MALHLKRRLLIPFIVLILAIAFRDAASKITNPSYQQILDWLPYVSLCMALALCTYYNRFRSFTMVLALLVIYSLIQLELQVALIEAEPLIIYSMISVALPVTLLLLMFLPECGICYLLRLFVLFVRANYYAFS